MSSKSSSTDETSETREPPAVVQDADIDNPLSFMAGERLAEILGRIERGEGTPEDLIEAIHVTTELNSTLDDIAAEWAAE